MKKFNFIEINYHHHDEFHSPGEVISKHRPSNLYFEEFSKYAEVTLVKHLNYEGEMQINEVNYSFFPRRNRFFENSSKMHRFVASLKPGIILVQGFIFPWQVMALRRKIGAQPKILLQHHGETPFKRKKIFQWMMGSKVNGWIFSSPELSREWIASGIIRNASQCFVLPPASTDFIVRDKELSIRKTGMKKMLNLLWVGRLNKNKDPFTVLKAFARFLEKGGKAELHLLYGEADLESAVKEMIDKNVLLKENSRLLGKIPHADLEYWYSAADYLISSSHQESGGYALIEAMACGAVPIVSEISASMQLTDGGRIGFHFPAGNAEALCQILLDLSKVNREKLSEEAVLHFRKELSPGAIAEKMRGICELILKDEVHT
jgi:glycosyltransferase involved in cell wall biosynthesis